VKKGLSILIVFLFVFKLGGFFVFHTLQQQHIRKEIKTAIKQGVPENELNVIKVTSENKELLDWKNEKEFRYGGVMYDVVKVKQISSETTVYYCVNDTKETILFAHLDEMVEKSMEGKGKQNVSLQFSFPYFFDKNTLLDIRNKNVIPKKESISSRCHLHVVSPSLSFEGPPPKLS
jgi:hypothetical protein